MSGGSKFSSEVPKGDAWGVEGALEKAAIEFEETGHSPMIPIIGVLGVKKVELVPGDDGPSRQIVARLFRINALTTVKAIRDGQKLVLRALQDRDGRTDAPMLPFEEKQIIDMAFGGLNVDTIEQDEREQIEDQNMDDPQRLRRHLVAVHQHKPEEIEGLEWVDVRTLHDSDHARPPEDGLPPHDPEWWAWRRLDLEAAEAESDGAADAQPDGGPVEESEPPAADADSDGDSATNREGQD